MDSQGEICASSSNRSDLE
jgi:nitrite reductase/ring-hydroxylating ferredoxin subunit